MREREVGGEETRLGRERWGERGGGRGECGNTERGSHHYNPPTYMYIYMYTCLHRCLLPSMYIL